MLVLGPTSRCTALTLIASGSATWSQSWISSSNRDISDGTAKRLIGDGPIDDKPLYTRE